eukprot:c51342_g1_i1 orf=93-362(+)
MCSVQHRSKPLLPRNVSLPNAQSSIVQYSAASEHRTHKTQILSSSSPPARLRAQSSRAKNNSELKRYQTVNEPIQQACFRFLYRPSPDC